MTRKNSEGFSMVEVTLALGIIGFALLAIFGLLPVGLTASREAGGATQSSLILQDVYNRVRSSINRGVYFDGTFAQVPLVTGPSPASIPAPLPAPWTRIAGAQSVTWFYDVNGAYRPEAMNGDFSRAHYRVEVRFGDTWDASTPIVPAPDVHFLRPVVVSISVPVNTGTGAAINPNAAERFSFNLRKP